MAALTTTDERAPAPFTDSMDAGHDDAVQQRTSTRWWREVIITVVFYVCYAAIRDAHGSSTVATQYGRALANARRVIDVEQRLHISWEHSLQVLALHARWLIRSANVFYGSAHFVVTVAVLIWLYRAQRDRYRRWRTVLAVGTALALIGFTLFPVLPPRLLPGQYGYMDTLHALGGLWSFNSGVVERISDPFAAMPSLHLCWATWCALVVFPTLRRRWTRALAVSYPVVTSVTVVITGNHYLLDLVGGVACLGLAMAICAVPSWWAEYRFARARAATPEVVLLSSREAA